VWHNPHRFLHFAQLTQLDSRTFHREGYVIHDIGICFRIQP
jgi:hypothetical protein